MDVERQVSYWKETAADDWRVAQKLIKDKELLHALFFVHLAFEKILKAHVCKQTKEYAPRIHNLLSLVRLTSIALTAEQEALLYEINTYNIRGRYPDMPFEKPSLQQTERIFGHAKELYKWLIKQL